MNELEFNYNLPITLLGGQDFNWEPVDDEYFASTQEAIIRIKPIQTGILWQTYPQKDNYQLIKKYFALDEAYETIIAEIRRDLHVTKAIQEFGNIKILRQPFEQTVLNFISSTNRNLKLIRQSRKLLSKNLGKDIKINFHRFYLYPATEEIAHAPIETLRQAKLGYRAEYIKRSANSLLQAQINETIKSMDEEQARGNLLQLEGVGPKVADCILTYSLGFSNVTPLDIWGQRFLIKLYNLSSRLNYEQMRKWYKNYFNGYAAYAGQFLFEYVRKHNIK